MPRSPEPPRRRNDRNSRSPPSHSISRDRPVSSQPYSSSSAAAASKRFDPRDDRDPAYKDLGSRRNGEKSRDKGYSSRDRDDERRADRGRYDNARGESDRQRGSASPPPRQKSPPKPNFGNSGLLAAETNTVNVTAGAAVGAGQPAATGVVLKYNEPPEARKPTRNWRLYVFKGKDQVGRDRIVADIPVTHPSCSKQHAVIQYRQVTEKNEFGDTKTLVKPFIIDLESTNGTSVNDREIPASRYYELKTNDIIKFGESTREYVFLPEEGGDE